MYDKLRQKVLNLFLNSLLQFLPILKFIFIEVYFNNNYK